MHRFTFLLLAFLLFPALAHANCVQPQKPHFPDPRTVAPDAVEKLDGDMQKYSANTNAYVACLSKAASDAQNEAAKTITDYNDQFLAVYNKRAQ
jgi:hypothetical protein